MNICDRCKHVVHLEGRESPRYECDYNWVCGKSSKDLIRSLDPVTGRPGFLKTNDVGTKCFVTEEDKALRRCRDMNPEGLCTLYEPKDVAK